MTVADLRELFAYDDWANARLFRAAAAVPAAQFAGPLRETLAHIVVEEWIWLRRCQGQNPAGPPAEMGSKDADTLIRMLTAIEQERRAFLAALSEDALDAVVTFRSLEGHAYQHRVKDLLFHILNHSTYHRGQVARLLREADLAPPETDFVVYREALGDA